MKIFAELLAKLGIAPAGDGSYDFASVEDETLAAFEAEASETLKQVASDPAAFAQERGVTVEDLYAEAQGLADVLRAARDELSGEEPVEASNEQVAAFADLADEFSEAEEEGGAEEAPAEEQPEDAPVEEGGEDVGEETVEAPEETASTQRELVASARVRRGRLPSPRGRRLTETREERQVSLVAAAGAPGMRDGQEFPDARAVADAMIARQRSFGIIPEGTSGEKVPIVRGNWKDLYPGERVLSGDGIRNDELIAAATDEARILTNFNARRKQGNSALVASGGLCAPVTPYYQLAMVSVADRPVRASLPSFTADRGGIRFARPATLASITTGVGAVTAANDALGGTFATKTCQVVDCPSFQEQDVEIIFHCLQFGNLGARTFPERVTQWNQLVMAAHARLAESLLLTAIDAASTQVTAANASGLGTSAQLLSQIRAAAAGMRSRHRMSNDAVLRVMLPWWSVYEFISDTYRGQFDRWEMTAAQVVSMLREFNVEPTFYVDGASGKSQVYGTQGAGALLGFPTTITWYLFPEGSFLYLDGGTLELGLVRDSVLNKTNDFQIFGETFESVAFVGVESLAVTSTVSDCGTVTAPKTLAACPIVY